MYQRCELTHRNWISGEKVGRVGLRQRSPYPSRTGIVNSSSCASKVDRKWCLPQEACIAVLFFRTGETAKFLEREQESAADIVGREGFVIEGPNSVERQVGVDFYE